MIDNDLITKLTDIATACDTHTSCDDCEYHAGSDCRWEVAVGSIPSGWELGGFALTGPEIALMAAIGANSVRRVSAKAVNLYKGGFLVAHLEFEIPAFAGVKEGESVQL